MHLHYFLIYFLAIAEGEDYFQFDTRSGDYQLGPDGTVQYSNLPSWMGTVTVSTGMTTVNGQVIPRGMQIWTVGTSAYYDIVAAGASGASLFSTVETMLAGRGIALKTRQYLAAGQQLIILVGMRPAGCYADKQSGGGGGTFVSIYAGTGAFNLKTQHTLLLAAGGGGGVGNFNSYPVVDAVNTKSATKCTGNPTTSVSLNGGGGGGYSSKGGDGVAGESVSAQYTWRYQGAGGGGAGFLGDGGFGGTNGFVGVYSSLRSFSFLNGGRGAQLDATRSSVACSTTSLDPVSRKSRPAGGFGGGGEGGGISGGGGGGYSGGQGCMPTDPLYAAGHGCGGGGGSYDANSENSYTTALGSTQCTLCNATLCDKGE